jgi:hypothetical protein
LTLLKNTKRARGCDINKRGALLVCLKLCLVEKLFLLLELIGFQVGIEFVFGWLPLFDHLAAMTIR